MPTLLPQRNYNDHDVINQFKFNPSGTYPVTKGTFVKILSGLMTDQQTIMLGSVGAAWDNTVSQRYGVQPSVATCTNTGDLAIGMLLYDVRVVDENSEQLIYHPEKLHQMQAVLSGTPVPIVTRGWFVYSGVEGTLPSAPGVAYLGCAGGVTTSGDVTSVGTKVGTFLGPADKNGIVYLKINL